MLDSILADGSITLGTFLACTAASLILGVLAALLCMYRNRTSRSFVLAIGVLPAVVQLIIMLVNGNIGTGVAVAGAFGLVRFRSASGSAREICMIFLAMAIGLATGMGYLFLAALFFGILAVFVFILERFGFGSDQDSVRDLKITIGENQDYDGLFDDLFEKYTSQAELERVRTTNMGTLYELEYRIVLRDEHCLKSFLDDIRCRNGNLNLVCGRPVTKDTL